MEFVMTTEIDAIVAEYAQQRAKATRAKYEYEKQEDGVKVLELRIELLSRATKCVSKIVEDGPAKPTNIETFIRENSAALTPDDLDFLQSDEHDVTDVMEFLGVQKKDVYALLESHELQPGASDKPYRGGKRMVDSISVVEFVIHGQSKKIRQRGLDGNDNV